MGITDDPFVNFRPKVHAGDEVDKLDLSIPDHSPHRVAHPPRRAALPFDGRMIEKSILRQYS